MNENFCNKVTVQKEIRLKKSEEKADRAAELFIANKELAFQSKEKADMAAKLIIANKELAFQNEEKGKRAAELLIANQELITVNAELVTANKAQEEFIANVSHELKTPLNVIFSGIQLIQMYSHNDLLEEKKEAIVGYLDSMKLNSYRLSKLINEIVDSSKIQAGFLKLNISNNNIVKVIEEIVMSVTNLTDIKGLHITFDTDIEEKNIAFDPEKIERIVLNLMSNAIKFSDEGDEIFVAIKDRIEFVEISVKDNGIGIKEEDLKTIFDRFKQVDKSLSRNTEGTGIGLNLVRSIIELHGGSIYAESEFGKGSKFIVNLPSKNVLVENILYNSKVNSNAESIRVEHSDVCS